MLRNILVIAGVVVGSCAYLWVSLSLVPVQYRPAVNFVAAPIIFGLLVGYLLVGGLPLKILLLPIVPISHVLLFGGDPAEPGVENLLALVWFVPLLVGCVIAHLLVRKRARAAPAQMDSGNP
jgi:hypothetical protein